MARRYIEMSCALIWVCGWFRDWVGLGIWVAAVGFDGSMFTVDVLNLTR